MQTLTGPTVRHTRLIAVSSIAMIVGALAMLAGASASFAQEDSNLEGRLGGTSESAVIRFGPASAAEMELLRFDAVDSPAGSAIVVAYLEDDWVSRMALVFEVRPETLQTDDDMSELVNYFAPEDGDCEDEPAILASGQPAYLCHSDALSEVLTDGAIVELDAFGSAGDYHYLIDPIADDYFEIVIEPGYPEGAASTETDLAQDDAEVTSAPEAETVTALPFEVVGVEDAHFGSRVRFALRIVIEHPEAYTEDALIATFVAALEQAFADLPQADAMMIFGYRPDTNTEGPVTAGRAAASRDGQGWSSDGELLDIGRPDDGRAQVFIGEYLPDLQMVTDEELHLVDLEIPA